MISPRGTKAGTKTLKANEYPPTFQCQLGHIRRAPSKNPMYQSGCEPAEMPEGLYGP